MDLSVAKICCRSFREILEILDADSAIFNGANPRPSYSMQFLHGIHTETTSIHVTFFCDMGLKIPIKHIGTQFVGGIHHLTCSRHVMYSIVQKS